MTLSKKDKEEIVEVVKEVLNAEHAADQWDKVGKAAITMDWATNSVKSKLANIEVASEDYYEIDSNGTKKTEFTWDEAMELKLPDGWRLPTRSEWVLLAEEFGQDKNGELNSQIFMDKLGLSLSEDVYGVWWSSSVYSGTYAYYLIMGASNMYPQSTHYKGYSFALRCVRDLEEGE